MAAGTVYRADELTQVSDVDLVEMVYEHVRQIYDFGIYDEFYFLLTEAFERFAPAVELEIVRSNHVDGPEAFKTTIRRMGERQALRLSAQASRLDGEAVS